MKLEYFVVSESVAIDQVTNSVSLFNVLEEASTRGFPAAWQHVAIVGTWIVDDNDMGADFQATINVRPPGGSLQPKTMHVNFSPMSKRHRIVVRVEGLRIPQAGEVEFELLLNGLHQASHKVHVRQETSDHNGEGSPSKDVG